jgi:LuxR family maltose regulon positive regulatory protein
LTSSLERFGMPLITSKLSAPQVRAGLVPRPQLLRQVQEATLNPFTLVCAPAGYGKTALLTNWMAGLKQGPGLEHPVIGWLSLDSGDNEPIRFLSYLVAAIEAAGAGISTDTRTMLQSAVAPPLQTILSVLINDLESSATPTFIVLDDYQSITDRSIHESMAFLLDHLPSNVHLVMATRSDPPIPLARLRALRQMVEFRAVDLRFSYSEMESLFNELMGLGLTSKDVARLDERTEGWIAGLQMAALALKGISQTKPEEISLFVSNFAGSNRYILDYLVEEVLNHQPREVQDFLLQTSILESLSGPLCDAVTGIRSRGSEGDTRSSQPILEYLERSNLFLVSLDLDRLWYRYHRLFADLLRARLEQSAPQLAPELHARASEWNEQNLRIPEAINHALDALDYGRACHLIEGLVEERMRAQSGLSLLWGWIRRLPPEIVTTRPWLCIVQAMSAMFLNDVDRIEPLLTAAEQAIRPDDRPDLHKTWQGHIACLRAFVADVHNDVPHAIEMAHLALGCLTPDDAATRAFAQYMLGRAYYIRGDFPEAIEALTGSVHECMQASLSNVIALSLSMLSMIYRTEGKLRDSLDLLADGRAYVESHDPRRVTIGGLAFVGQAIVLNEWNDLDEAERIIRRSLDLCEPWASPSATCRCYLVLARVLQSQGRLPAAEDALRLAEESIRARSPVPEVICDLNAVKVGLWLATQQLSKASQWAQEWQKGVHPETAFSLPKEQNEITLARVLIAEGSPDAALQTLGRLATAAESAGRMGHLIQIRELQALAFYDQGNQAQALEMLNESLALARPEGYMRTYIDEGERMRELLLALMQTASSENKLYTQKVLGMFAAPGPVGASITGSSNLVEPLTAREIEVLQAMAEGCSNRQIAEKLILAEGTVKFYVHAVLEKLGVHNRTQAVIEAKRQRII